MKRQSSRKNTLYWNPDLWMRFPIARPPSYRVIQKVLLGGKIKKENILNYRRVREEEYPHGSVIDINVEEYIKNTQVLDGEKLIEGDPLEEGSIASHRKAGEELPQKHKIIDIDVEEYIKNTEVLDGEKLVDPMGVRGSEVFIKESEPSLQEYEKGKEIEKAERLTESFLEIPGFIEEKIEREGFSLDEEKTENLIEAQPQHSLDIETEKEDRTPDIVEDFSGGIESISETDESEKSVTQEEEESKDSFISQIQNKEQKPKKTESSNEAQPQHSLDIETEKEDRTPDIVEDFSGGIESISETDESEKSVTQEEEESKDSFISQIQNKEQKPKKTESSNEAQAQHSLDIETEKEDRTPDIVEDFSGGIESISETDESEKSVTQEEEESKDSFISQIQNKEQKPKKTESSIEAQAQHSLDIETEKEDRTPDIVANLSGEIESVSETDESEKPLSQKEEEVSSQVEQKSPPPEMLNKSRRRIFSQELKEVTSKVLGHPSKVESPSQIDRNAVYTELKEEKKDFLSKSISIPIEANRGTETSEEKTQIRDSKAVSKEQQEQYLKQARKGAEALQEILKEKPYHKTQIVFLKKLYNTDLLKEEHFIALQEQILRYFHTDGMAFLLWDRFQLCYRPILHSNLHEKELLYSLYLVDQDPLLQEHQFSQSWDQNTILKNPENLRRLGKSFLTYYKAVHILKVGREKEAKPAFLMLLYKKLPSTHDPKLQFKLKEPPEEYMDFLKECIPPLHRFRAKLWYEKIGARQLGIITREALGIMEQLAGKSKKRFYALHFRLIGLENDKNWHKKTRPLLALLSRHLEPQEKLLIHNINQILFLLQETDPNHIIKLAQEFYRKEDNVQLYLSLNEYPKKGYNLYRYLEGPRTRH